jgi:pSer/pThr/pTyr-binding forkhead associated (FHA) protein
MSTFNKGIYLAVSKEDQTVQIYELTGEITLIGRSPLCEVIIHDESISRTHARIRRVGDQEYTLEDLGSTNGTYLKGYPVSGEMALRCDDEIILGDGIIAMLKEGAFEPFFTEQGDPGDETQLIPPTREVDMSKYRGISLEDLP